MLVSIITPTFNSEKTILDTLTSIEAQTHNEIEHIIIDGLSTDSTKNIVANFLDLKNKRYFISMPDDGIYDAMNKGFRKAKGDILCILNSDDFYKDRHILSNVVKAFQSSEIDYVYSDAEMVNNSMKTIRYIRTGDINKKNTQIPHPCLWVRRQHIQKMLPPFDIRYSIAADLKFQLQLKHTFKLNSHYLPFSSTIIRMGGVSNANLSSIVNGWLQSRSVVNEVLGKGGTFYILKKVLRGIFGIILVKLKFNN